MNGRPDHPASRCEFRCRSHTVPEPRKGCSRRADDRSALRVPCPGSPHCRTKGIQPQTIHRADVRSPDLLDQRWRAGLEAPAHRQRRARQTLSSAAALVSLYPSRRSSIADNPQHLNQGAVRASLSGLAGLPHGDAAKTRSSFPRFCWGSVRTDCRRPKRQWDKRTNAIVPVCSGQDYRQFQSNSNVSPRSGEYRFVRSTEGVRSDCYSK